MERDENESSPKRRKLDSSCSNKGVLCNGDGFSNISATSNMPIDTCEGTSLDYDSGYSAPTPSLVNLTSPGDTTCDTTLESQDDVDDNASSVSGISDLSALSDLSGQAWKPMSGSILWIQRQMQSGIDPRQLLTKIGVDHEIPPYLDDVSVWKCIIDLLSEPPKRHKLRHVNTLDDVVRLLKGAKNIIVLTGAGVSVSCGIPDFRSRDGIYARLAADFADLPDPQAMFDINYFTQDPRPFFRFARDIYPGKFQPSPCHKFIKLLEKHNKLLRNYTQNIDTLEREASIEKVVECHGSFATATCTKCSYRVTAEIIKEDIQEQRIPLCPVCQPTTIGLTNDELSNDYRELVSRGIMKPDIVFFGEGLPEHFHEAMTEDKTRCDLLLVIGSSLKVRPVALIPLSVPPDVPQVLINREPLPHCNFDVELLGDCDVIINQLCHLLGGNWGEDMNLVEPLQEAQHLAPVPDNLLCNSVSLKDEEGVINNEPESSTSGADLNSKETCKVKVTNSIINCSCRVKSNSNVRNSTTVSECRCLTMENAESSSSEYLDLKHIKERHISVDSAKDSGIGDSSNSTDTYAKNFDGDDLPSDSNDMRGYWQPKIKHSLSERLPKNSFYLVPPCRYIFPGAEVFYDPDDNNGTSDLSDTECSDSESDSDDDGKAESEDSINNLPIAANNDH